MFGSFSFDIDVLAHVSTQDWEKFLAISEDINLRTVEVLEKAGAKLAVPPRQGSGAINRQQDI